MTSPERPVTKETARNDLSALLAAKRTRRSRVPYNGAILSIAAPALAERRLIASFSAPLGRLPRKNGSNSAGTTRSLNKGFQLAELRRKMPGRLFGAVCSKTMFVNESL